MLWEPVFSGVAGMTDAVISSWRSQTSTGDRFGGMNRKDSGQSMLLVGMRSHEGIKGKQKTSNFIRSARLRSFVRILQFSLSLLMIRK